MILPDQTLLEFRIELEELITQREGMIAFNLHRDLSGGAAGYNESDFGDVERAMKMLRDRLTKRMGG